MSLTVVKVGGSLFDLPDLGDRLRRWLVTLERHASFSFRAAGRPWRSSASSRAAPHF